MTKSITMYAPLNWTTKIDFLCKPNRIRSPRGVTVDLPLCATQDERATSVAHSVVALSRRRVGSRRRQQSCTCPEGQLKRAAVHTVDTRTSSSPISTRFTSVDRAVAASSSRPCRSCRDLFGKCFQLAMTWHLHELGLQLLLDQPSL